MSEPTSNDLIATPEELTDADLEQVAGGFRASPDVAGVAHAAVHANVAVHATPAVQDIHVTKQVDVHSVNI